MRALVSCPGTCGELYQGWLGGICSLISCPIDRTTYMEVEVNPGTGDISVPEGMDKTGDVLGLASKLWRCRHLDVSVRSFRRLPVSRGYASSTADMISALYGLAVCIDRIVSPEEVTEMAVAIEPSDGIAWSDLVLLDHRSLSNYTVISEVPPLKVVLFDPEEEVDTVEFNRRVHPLEGVDYDGILHDLIGALMREDWIALGRAVTASARANQGVLFKPCLEELIEVALSDGALGVTVAHSGSICGVLYPPDVDLRWAELPWPDEVGSPRLAKMVPGGVHVLEVAG
jgi:L-threonine kinase